MRREVGERPPLPDGEVHVWTVPLDRGAQEITGLWRLLDEPETARASRFRFDRDRNVFVVTRGILRTLLAHYAGGRPEEIRFAYGPFGKPSLQDAASVRFNVSHSGGIALLAFARSVEVGIDVECIRSLPDRDDVAERFFSTPEVKSLRRFSADERDSGFFRCWTAKEAYIKGIGEGLSMPLDKFAVSLRPASGHVALRPFGMSDVCWSLERWEPAKGYVAALAVEGGRQKLRVYLWPDRDAQQSQEMIAKSGRAR